MELGSHIDRWKRLRARSADDGVARFARAQARTGRGKEQRAAAGSSPSCLLACACLRLPLSPSPLSVSLCFLLKLSVHLSLPYPSCRGVRGHLVLLLTHTSHFDTRMHAQAAYHRRLKVQFQELRKQLLRETHGDGAAEDSQAPRNAATALMAPSPAHTPSAESGAVCQLARPGGERMVAVDPLPWILP